VNINVEKIDSANFKIVGKISKDDIEKEFNKLAKEATKTVKVDGFRAGKVPVAIVKKLFGDKLKSDAEGQALRKALDEGYKKANIKEGDIIGEPIFEKYNKSDSGDIEFEISLSLKPTIELGDYSDLTLDYKKPEVTEKDIDEEIKNIAKNFSKLKSIKEDRALKEGDVAVFDFKGFVDGKAFEGGTAEDYELKIGSGQFIDGFESQMVGMKKGEEKVIKVKFPEEYHSKELAGKDAEFKVKLKDIKELSEPEIDDELAKKALGQEDVTLKELREYAKNIIQSNKNRKLYQDELKPKLIEKLLKKYKFDLPRAIVEQEIDNLVNQKAQTLTEDEINEIKASEEKLKELRESVRKDAEDSVRITFLVDALAKAENIEVADGEVSQILYYEALMNGQDPQATFEYYQKNNLLPVIKMGILEDKLFSKLLKLEDN
jgi:trigger factor